MILSAEYKQVVDKLEKIGSYESASSLIHGLMVLASDERMEVVSPGVVNAYLRRKRLDQDLRTHAKEQAFADLVVCLVATVNRARQRARVGEDY